MKIRKALITPIAALAVLAAFVGLVLADGTETLGPPSISIASGTGIVAAGTGLASQPGTINVNVPAGAAVEQVLLYWGGQSTYNATVGDTGPGDNTVNVNGTGVTGDLIGGPTHWVSLAGQNFQLSSFRADITGLGVVSSGMNSLQIDGFDNPFGSESDGAGVAVIIDDGTGAGEISIRDGNDMAFAGAPAPRDTTVAQTFGVTPAAVGRVGELVLFVGDGTDPAVRARTSTTLVTVGGVTTTYPNLYVTSDGKEWDTVHLAVDIPAGADSVTVQILSDGSDPESLYWVAAALSVGATAPLEGRVTGGGNIFLPDGSKVTRGLELHCDGRAPNNLQVDFHTQARDNFHLDNQSNLLFSVCFDFPAIFQDPPPGTPIDTFVGKGTGRLNNVDGAVTCFVLVDDGEPGTTDMMAVQIFPVGTNPDTITCQPKNLGETAPSGGGVFELLEHNPAEVLYVSGVLDRGNIQMHEDNQ